MSLVPQLEAELVDAARRASSAPLPKRRVRRSMLVFAMLAGPVAAAVAIAAPRLIGTGSPLKPPGHQKPNPKAGLGVIRPGSAQVLPIAVPDPAGGPPWGLRYFTTTRGLGCLQAGRVQNGQLGVIGQDGVFNDDGQFHPYVPDYMGGNYSMPFPCGVLDANGHAFGAVSIHGVPASGLMVPSATQRGCVAHHDHGPIGRRPNQPPICPRKDWRLLYYGMAGPEAKSVTYVVNGQRKTIATGGNQGAYLIVLPVPRKSFHALGSFEPMPAPGGGPIVRIDYRNGYVCHLRRRAQDNGPIGGTCPLVGRVLVKRPQPKPTDVASPVTARLGKAHYGPKVVVSFIARVGVTDASAQYTGIMRLNSHGINCHAIEGGGTYKDINAGQRVQLSFPTQRCHGTFRGEVRFNGGQNTALGPTAGPGQGVLVGKFKITVR